MRRPGPARPQPALAPRGRSSRAAMMPSTLPAALLSRSNFSARAGSASGAIAVRSWCDPAPWPPRGPGPGPPRARRVSSTQTMISSADRSRISPPGRPAVVAEQQPRGLQRSELRTEASAVSRSKSAAACGGARLRWSGRYTPPRRRHTGHGLRVDQPRGAWRGRESSGCPAAAAPRSMVPCRRAPRCGRPGRREHPEEPVERVP